MSLKSLNATSEMLVRASGQLDKRIAAHLVAIANHVNGKGNGDTSAVNYFWSLVTAGGKSGLRADAIGNWLLAYCGVTYNDKTKKYGRKRDFQYDVQLAVENPWYLFTKQAEFKPFNLDKALAALIKKAHTALEDTEHSDKHVVSKDMLKRIEALLDSKPLPKTTTIEVKPEGWDSVDGGAGPNGHEAEEASAPIISEAA